MTSPHPSVEAGPDDGLGVSIGGRGNRPGVSVVVPTRNEAPNIDPLVSRLLAVFDREDIEILFVDDSDDDTPQVIDSVAERLGPAGTVRLLHREADERSGGLGGAVKLGLAASRAAWVVVMDGDLEHPPEMVPSVVSAGREAAADAVVATRYHGNGSVDGLDGPVRRIVSRWSGALARLAFPRRLAGVTDPMSGFFAVRSDVVDTDGLRPDGYTILLEILVRNRMERIKEVPYDFGARENGESKASLGEGLRFARHLAVLRLLTASHPQSTTGRMVGFALAGGSGIAVNTLALWLLSGVLGIAPLVAAALATQVAVGWNFLLVDHFVMTPNGSEARASRFARFWLLMNALIPVQLALFAALAGPFDLHYLVSNLISIGVVFGIRYAITTRWVYRAATTHIDTTNPAAWRKRARSSKGRLLVVLTRTTLGIAAPFPGGLDILWSSGDTVGALVPVSVGLALMVGRLRPRPGEPDVQDRQVDGLLGTAFLLCTLGALVMRDAATSPAADTWGVLAAMSFAIGATVLLLGTRTAARLRWALAVPLLAVDAFVPDGLVAAADHGLSWAATDRDFVSPGTVVAALGAAVLATLCSHRSATTRLLRVIPLFVAIVGTAMLLAAFSDAFLPAESSWFGGGRASFVGDLLLASITAAFAWRWSLAAVGTSGKSAAAQLPPLRRSAVVLAAAAVLMGTGTAVAGIQEAPDEAGVHTTRGWRTAMTTGAEQLQFKHDDPYLVESVRGLADRSPTSSAYRLLTRAQRLGGVGVLAALVCAFGLWPMATLQLLVVCATIFYVGALVLRIELVRIASKVEHRIQVSDNDARAVDDADLPIYTVLVPAYREPSVIGLVMRHIAAMEYPTQKLDVKLLLEADDHETIAAAEAALPGSHVQIVLIPSLDPQTKPKACNYGLQLAEGEFVTIYDAEDRPDPLQLRKAVVAMRRVGPEYACLQAELGYFNTDQNRITRWFTLEYATWFRSLLPGLVALGMPIPLGGTSNHFRRKVLQDVGAWDPFNVTEDADLGLRLARVGHKIGVLDSITEEEANSDFINWVKQRSRWYKGYLQTWLVHMRAPRTAFRKVGWRGVVALTFLVGGTPLTALINPLFWGMTVAWLIAEPAFLEALFVPAAYYVGMLLLVFGNATVVYLNVLAVRSIDRPDLLGTALLSPIYWAMMSLAAAKAALQLVVRPSYWEKTTHGLHLAPAALREDDHVH